MTEFLHELRCAANGCQARKLIKRNEAIAPHGWRVVGASLLCPLHAGCATPVEVTTVENGAEKRVAALGARILAADPTPDELSVIELIVERTFGKGRVSYGPLRIALDDRDFEQEALEELVDAPIYGAIGTIRRRRIRSAT